MEHVVEKVAMMNKINKLFSNYSHLSRDQGAPLPPKDPLQDLEMENHSTMQKVIKHLGI